MSVIKSMENKLRYVNRLLARLALLLVLLVLTILLISGITVLIYTIVKLLSSYSMVIQLIGTQG